MKVFLKNVIIKKILMIFITIIMVSNFIMPNYVCAADPGKQIVSGFFYLLSYVGDTAIQIMQKMMIGYSSIGNDNIGYKIAYSPGMIFSNEVEALDINFINPMPDEPVSTTNNYRVWGYDTGTENYFEECQSVIDRMQPKGEFENITDWWSNEYDKTWEDIKRSYGYYDDTSIQVVCSVDEEKYLGADTLEKIMGYISNVFIDDGITYDSAVWIQNDTAYMLVNCTQRGRIHNRCKSRYGL